MNNLLKKMSDSLIFDERPDDLLTLLIKKEGMSESLFFIKKTFKKHCKKYDFSQIFQSKSLVFCELKSE